MQPFSDGAESPEMIRRRDERAGQSHLRSGGSLRRSSRPTHGAGGGLPLYHGGHWPVGVPVVLHGMPIVPGTPASACGGAWPLELRNIVRDVGHPQRQRHPPDAGRRQTGCLRWAVFQGDGDTLCASLAAQYHQQAVPLSAEFIVSQDGAGKQDREHNATKRWLAKHGSTMARWRPVYLGDDLFACQPTRGAPADRRPVWLARNPHLPLARRGAAQRRRRCPQRQLVLHRDPQCWSTPAEPSCRLGCRLSRINSRFAGSLEHFSAKSKKCSHCSAGCAPRLAAAAMERDPTGSDHALERFPTKSDTAPAFYQPSPGALRAWPPPQRRLERFPT